jgi:sugar phosphate isomerase/epimerase
MKIGFPNHPRRDVLEEIAWIGRNGFDFVDLFLEEDVAVPERIDARKVKALLRRYGLGVVGHTAWYLPTGSPLRSLREAAVSEAARCFGTFSAVGARYVTIHANWPPGMFTREEGVRFQTETLRKLVKSAKEFGLEVMYEPIDTDKDGLESVSEILRKVPGLWLHIDTGHCNLHGRNPEDFVRKFHKRLKHVHMHDNDGERDLHLPIGTGRTDWKRLINVLKKHYDGTITLEVFSPDRDYALLSRDKLRKLWSASR